MNDELATFLEGDCVEVMATMPDASVDAVVTDPPYGLEFMGKEWDRLDTAHKRRDRADELDDPVKAKYLRHSVEYQRGPGVQPFHYRWATEAYRLLKPGGYLLAFGGTRTVHRLASAIEDAGFEIRDCLCWIYASGFPKSLNLGNGWGTALKPAWEPIVMARKPLRGTVAANVTTYGTGALNIDGTRIPTDGRPLIESKSEPSLNAYGDGLNGSRHAGETTAGRWPANLLLTDPLFDGGVDGVVGGGATESAWGKTSRGGNAVPVGDLADQTVGGFAMRQTGQETDFYKDTGTYSRFFLIPKAARSDREPVLRGQLAELEQASTWGDIGPVEGNPRKPDNGHVTKRENLHPTVKPVELMRHLVRLVTPPGGVVLDPFLGSGSTAIAANMEGFRCIGIEREAEYLEIARARMAHQKIGMGL